MTVAEGEPLEALLVAVPETAGSALYGMIDVLAATGCVWPVLTGTGSGCPLIHPRICSIAGDPFRCGNAIPVIPERVVADDPAADIVILPELWLAPDEPLTGRYPELMTWLRRRYAAGASLYAACSGSIMLAESGLLDGRNATSHWGNGALFRQHYPRVRFHPEPALLCADATGRIVTAGGTTSWHDLALHIVARHTSPDEALRIAKVYLLKWHGEGQLPYTALIRQIPHADSLVRTCETWLGRHFREPHAVTRIVEAVGVPERTLKRRFKAATTTTLIESVQNLRIEEAKHLLETTETAAEEISAAVGYEDPAFFRRLFKRRTGLTTAEYRRLFRPIAQGAVATSSGYN